MTQHYDNQLSQLGQSAHTTKACVSEQTSGCPKAHLAIPDVGLHRGLQDKAVIGVEGGGYLLHLHCSGVEGGGALDLEKSSAIHVVRVTLKAVLEARGLPALDTTGRNTGGQRSHQMRPLMCVATCTHSQRG